MRLKGIETTKKDVYVDIDKDYLKKQIISKYPGLDYSLATAYIRETNLIMVPDFYDNHKNIQEYKILRHATANDLKAFDFVSTLDCILHL